MYPLHKGCLVSAGATRIIGLIYYGCHRHCNQNPRWSQKPYIPLCSHTIFGSDYYVMFTRNTTAVPKTKAGMYIHLYPSICVPSMFQGKCRALRSSARDIAPCAITSSHRTYTGNTQYTTHPRSNFLKD